MADIPIQSVQVARAIDITAVSVGSVPTEEQGEPLDVSAATVTVTDDGSFDLNSTTLDPALASNSGDELRVDTSPSEPLDVSSATVTVTDDGSFDLNSTPLDPALSSNNGDQVRVDIENNNAGLATDATLTNTLDRNVAQVGGTAQSGVDVANKQQELADALQNAFASDDQLRVDLENDNIGGLSVDTSTSEPIGTDGNSSVVTTSSTGSGNAAELSDTSLKEIAVFWDTSGSASITVEVSWDGNTWIGVTGDVISSQPGGSETARDTFETPFPYVRAYIDQNVNTLGLAGKGT